MVADDSALLEHLLAHDEAAAVRAWSTTMDDALASMLAQLPPRDGIRCGGLRVRYRAL
ncbi:MAG TPA: hypothetical protein VFL59_11095 [Candidatus Nanopelagicales bacterium]|nr:hypothetical protein [Candidatus Nanopelagicales bacterium]